MKRRVTTHVLDLASGRPGAGIPVLLERATGDTDWDVIGRASTDGAGRAEPLTEPGRGLIRGIYRLTFETDGYFRARGAEYLYPVITVVFRVEHPDEDYHLPILLSPFGFSTYRGS